MRDLLRVVIFNHSTITEETVQARYALIMKRLDHIDNYCQSLEINRVQYLDESARLREIVSPTLIVWGREDRVLPLDLGQHIAALIPDSEMHIFSRCGHVPHIEYAARFNQLASSFLDGSQ